MSNSGRFSSRYPSRPRRKPPTPAKSSATLIVSISTFLLRCLCSSCDHPHTAAKGEGLAALRLPYVRGTVAHYPSQTPARPQDRSSKTGKPSEERIGAGVSGMDSGGSPFAAHIPGRSPFAACAEGGPAVAALRAATRSRVGTSRFAADARLRRPREARRPIGPIGVEA